MKKFLLYSLLGVAALSATSCNEDFNDVAAPQAWEQEAAIALPQLTISPVGTISYAEVIDSIVIFNPSLNGELPEGARLDNFYVDLVAENGKKKTLNTSSTGKVATAELQATIEELYGKRPIDRKFNATVYANIIINGQASLIKGETTVTAIPVAPQISEHYYLIGAPSEWNPTCVTMPFSHSDKNVYDDPIFTIVFPIADGETWFAVTDDITVEKNDWSQVFGCAEGNGNNTEEGILKRRYDLTDDGSFKVVVDGDAKFIKMTLNMMEYTYKIEKLNFQEEYIYVPGNHQGWSPETAPRLHGPGFDGIYTGFSWLDGGFKFTKGPGWSYGEYNWGSFTSHPEGFTGEGGGDITCTTKGFYFIKANVADGTLETIPTTWGIIGDATANGWDSDQDMTWDEEKHCWCATITLTDGTIKFRANDGWDINFGGDPANLNAGGDNIPVTAGTYDIDLYLERTTSDKMYCTLTKK